ncbi:MAG: hypothetical protein LC808_10995, partial [Actinobacteria bacterium]|nr:hypothetical protein [Actinomycetota bacterium]
PRPERRRLAQENFRGTPARLLLRTETFFRTPFSEDRHLNTYVSGESRGTLEEDLARQVRQQSA